MKRGKTYAWIPLWIDKWLWGSTRHELAHDERAIFTDLLALATKDDGYIRANPTTPYPLEQLAGMLCAPIELLKRTISQSLHYGKLEEPLPGIYRIASWEGYQLTDRRKRDLEPISEIKEQCSEKPAPLYVSVSVLSQSIISYLNERAGKNFSPKSKPTIGHISGRIDEGRTLDDFKKVIDLKVAKWKGKTWPDTRKGREGQISRGDDFLCPATLFCSKNFENYLNESATPAKVKKTLRVLQRDGSYEEVEVEE